MRPDLRDGVDALDSVHCPLRRGSQEAAEGTHPPWKMQVRFLTLNSKIYISKQNYCIQLNYMRPNQATFIKNFKLYVLQNSTYKGGYFCRSLSGFTCRHRTEEVGYCNMGCANGGWPVNGGGSCTCRRGFNGQCCDNGGS